MTPKKLKLKKPPLNHSAVPIKKIFSNIAHRYDLANKMISLGMDTQWRQHLVQWSPYQKAGRVLDGACGTGALAFEFIKMLGPKASITAVDFCPEMLNEAHKNWQALRTKNQDMKDMSPSRIQFQLGDMENLSFPDNTFDITACAYGLRNVNNLAKALHEMARVTKPQGVLMILETGGSPPWFVSPALSLYFRWVVPQIGGLITGQKTAYEYLQKTSRHFPARDQFLKKLKDTHCFSQCHYKSLFFGASFIYKAYVI